MGLFTQDPVTMVPTDQQSAGSTKGHASDLTSTSRSVKDQIAARLFSQAGSAVASLQQQIDAIMQVLRAPVPQPATYAVTDPEGNLIAWLGYNVVDNEVYQGGWFKQFYVGGTDAAHAVISSDINGNVTINGATIKLIGTGGTILLDPSVPDIVITDLVGDVITLEPARFTVFALSTNYQTRIENGVITVEDATTHKPATQISPDVIGLVGPAGTSTIFIQSIGNDGFIEVLGGSGANDITLDGTTGDITATGSISGSSGAFSGVVVVSNASFFSRLGFGTVQAGSNATGNIHARMDADGGSGGGSIYIFDTAGTSYLAGLDVVGGHGALCIGGIGQQVVGPRLAAISAPSISTTTIVATAGAAYTATEQGMLNSLKAAVNQLNADVISLQSTTNTTISRLQTHGLTS